MLLGTNHLFASFLGSLLGSSNSFEFFLPYFRHITLPVLLAHFLPNLPTEAIVASVLGALGGVLGISMEDVAKQKRAALEAAASQGKKSSD